MSNADGTCEYVLDPDDPETWGGELGDECHDNKESLNEENVWSCPHFKSEGHEFCIFHKPIEQKENSNLIEELLDIIRESSTGSTKSEFLGAKFGDVNISDSVFGTESEVPINLKHSRFLGK